MKLEKYSKYSYSGFDWIGDIPEGWIVEKNKHLFTEIKKLSAFGNEMLLSVSDKVGIKPRSEIIGQEDNLSNAETLEGYKKCKKDDLIMNIMLAWKGALGVSDYDGIVSPAYVVYRGKGIVPKYFHYLFRTKLYGTQFKRFSTGIIDSRLRLYPEEFFNIFAIVPRKDEQKKIVTFLSNKINKINNALKKNKSLGELLKEKRLALIENAINSEEVCLMRLGFVTDSFQRSIIRRDDELYTPLGLYNWGRGLFHKEPRKGEELGDSTFFYIKENDLIISGQFAWEGAVALSGKGEAGCVVSHRFPVIRGKEEFIYTEYLWAFLTSEIGHSILDKCSIGSAGRNRPLNFKSLMKEKIPIPSLEIQRKIIDVVKIEQNLNVLSKKFVKLLEEYKKSLIYNVVTGKVDVTNK